MEIEGTCGSKNLDEMDTRDRRRVTTRDYRGDKQRSPSGQLIGRVVPREKQVSGDLYHFEETKIYPYIAITLSTSLKLIVPSC